MTTTQRMSKERIAHIKNRLPIDALDYTPELLQAIEAAEAIIERVEKLTAMPAHWYLLPVRNNTAVVPLISIQAAINPPQEPKE